MTRPVGLVNCAKVMDCSIPLNFQNFQMMVPMPEEKNRIGAPIRPFQYQVCFSNANI